MFDGVQLTLLAGPAVPMPVPRVVLDALRSVEVRTRDRFATRWAGPCPAGYTGERCPEPFTP